MMFGHYFAVRNHIKQQILSGHLCLYDFSLSSISSPKKILDKAPLYAFPVSVYFRVFVNILKNRKKNIK